MKILYVTDLHGAAWKYERALERARETDARAILNGADLYPKDLPLLEQHRFVTDFLEPHFAACERAGVANLLMPGNDDLLAFDPLFESACERSRAAKNIAQRRVDLDGYAFIGMNWVVDYPFRLKDRCRMDTPEYVFQRQLGKGTLSDGRWPNVKGMRELDDWIGYARGLPTIRDELRALVQPEDWTKAVHVIHMPPARLGLDRCNSGEAVGSEAVLEFIRERQPRLTLHGHIHESPRLTGVWKAEVGRTVCVQPGQLGDFAYVVIDLDTLKMERVEEGRA